MSRIVRGVIAVVIVSTATLGVDRAAAAAPTDPSVIISVEWMNTSGSAQSRVDWMFDLTVELTSAGVDLGDRCQHVVWGDQQPSFVGIRFECFDIPYGTYSFRLVGVPADETPTTSCPSVTLPYPVPANEVYCLISFFSAGVLVDDPASDYPPGPTDEPVSENTPEVPVAKLPATGGIPTGQIVFAAMTAIAGLVLLAAARRRRLLNEFPSTHDPPSPPVTFPL